MLVSDTLLDCLSSSSSSSSIGKRGAVDLEPFERPKVEPLLIGGNPIKEEWRFGVSSSIKRCAAGPIALARGVTSPWDEGI